MPLACRSTPSSRPAGRLASRVQAAAATVCSFETLLIAFLFAGRYKADPRFAWVPVDLTALFFGLSVLSGLAIWLQRGARVARPAAAQIATYWLFALWAACAMLWSSSEAYAAEKALALFTLNAWPLIAGALLLAPDPVRQRRFLSLVVLLASWFAIESFLVYRTSNGVFVSALGSNYLGLGRVIGLATLVVLGRTLFESGTPLQRLARAGGVAMLAYVLLFLGGRGPFLATGVAAAVPLLGGIRRGSRGVTVARYALPLGLVLLVGAGVVGWLVMHGGQTKTLARLMLLFSGDMGDSAGDRAAFYRRSWELWQAHPLWGLGLGGWPVAMSMGDIRAYPHNMALEVLVELGIIGAGVLALLLLRARRGLGPWRVIRDDPARLVLAMLAVNALANAMVTGDLSDNRVVFLLLGWLAALPRPGAQPSSSA